MNDLPVYLLIRMKLYFNFFIAMKIIYLIALKHLWNVRLHHILIYYLFFIINFFSKKELKPL